VTISAATHAVIAVLSSRITQAVSAPRAYSPNNPAPPNNAGAHAGLLAL